MPSEQTKINHLNAIKGEMKFYILLAITNLGREIKCEKCGSFSNIELHHSRYSPQGEITIKDIRFLCAKCHRNDSKSKKVRLSTVFKNGKRYCVGSNFKFAY